jgi:DNA-directed RNA polymerase, sigma subunit (sigma70/sigma32)
MNQEALFARTLEQVKEQAAGQGGWIGEEEVQEAFAPLGLSGEQLQMVYDYLVKHKIGIGAPVNPDDYLTEEEKNYLQNYLDELESLPKATPGEKEAITLSAMAGDLDAQGQLAIFYLPDVVEVARLYSGQGVPLEDLIGEGNLALTAGVSMLGALERTDEAQGMLGKMMMDAMEELIQQQQTAEKADQKMTQRINKVLEAARSLSEELHRKVTVEELAQEAKLSEKAIREAVRLSGHQIEYLEDIRK